MMSFQVIPLFLCAAVHAAPSAAQAVPTLLPRVHVINLQNRPERRNAIEERIVDIMPDDLPLDYSILNASDKKDAQDAIDAGIVRTDREWDDGVGRQGMTLGEVGCALSHTRAWQSIAEELESSPEKYAIVIEDDAMLSADFPSRIGDVVASAAANDAGFVYLAYGAAYYEFEDKRIKVDEYLQTCVYNWWALAYMISGSAAAKLATSSKTFLQNLIPVDEYLTIVLGTRDGYGEVIEGGKDFWGEEFSDTRIKCLTVRGDTLASPNNDPISDTLVGDIALVQTQAQTLLDYIEEDSKLLTFTMATDSNHFGYQSLRRSAGFLGHTLINLGEGTVWGGYNTKLILMKEALEKVRDDRLVMFVDGYDTLLQRCPEETVARFEALVEDFQQEHYGGEIDDVEYSEPVIFGAEDLCWPVDEVCEQYEEGTAYAGRNRYLNSGTYIGRAGLIRELLEDLDSKPDGDDQLYYSEKLVRYIQSGTGVPIVLDGEKILFQTLLSNELDWKIEIEDDRDGIHWLYHHDDDMIPAVIHGQGPAKHTLIGISNYIPGAYSDSYRISTRHTYVQTTYIYPLAIGLFFIEETNVVFEAQFVASIESLNIDASQTRVFVQGISDEQKQRVCSSLGGRYVNCITSNETDEALARAEFLTLAESNLARAALMVDSDVIVTRASLVQDLAKWNRSVVVGHAQIPAEDVFGTNYWTDMDHWAGSQGYRRGFDAPMLYMRERTGLFQVPFARGLFLVQNTELSRLASIFSKVAGSEDDAVRRACLVATDKGLPIYVDNTYEYATFFGAVEDEIAIEPTDDETEQGDDASSEMSLVPNHLLRASLAVLVKGAGSSEVNGCYQLNGRNGMAWQFDLENGERIFEIFKVEGGSWWNIMERVQGSYPIFAHYGVDSDDDAVLPPRDGWGSSEYMDSWLGNAPAPKIEVTIQKTCILWEESNGDSIDTSSFDEL